MNNALLKDENVISIEKYVKRKSRNAALANNFHMDGEDSNVTRTVYPIKNPDDLRKCVKYFIDKGNNATRKDTKLSAYRDALLFTIGVNVGLRVSDLIRLQWDHIFEPDMKTFRKRQQSIKEKKTGKIRSIVVNDTIENSITRYIKASGVTPKFGEKIFLNVRTKTPITDSVVEKMIKEVTSACGIEGDYGTHTLRKTYAYAIYKMHLDEGDETALAYVQRALNHRSTRETIKYLGMEKENEIQESDKLSSYLNLLDED